MLRGDTVLILGAGSSVEFGLPQGADLARKIATDVNFYFDGNERRTGDAALWEALFSAERSRGNEFVGAGRVISRGLPMSRSIDDFLFNHGHDQAVVDLGKSAIVASILAAERGSRLRIEPSTQADTQLPRFHGLADTWAYKLFTILATGVRRANVDQLFHNLKIIDFNYDRCVEHFFLRAVQYAYSVDEADATRVLSSLEIVHPYGQVGRLPWQTGSTPAIAFGVGAPGAQLLALRGGIKTFTEQAHDQAEVESWRDMLREARQIVVLGFGFHRQNLELLDPGRRDNEWPRAFVTAYGTSAADQMVFADAMQALRGFPPGGFSSPNMQNMTCAAYLDAFGLQMQA